VCAFLGVGLRLYKYYILAPWLDPQFTIITEVWNFSRIVSEILSSAMIITLAVTIKLLKNKTELEQQNSQLQEEKKQVELFYLKAQMQPHFLFNTLNTLYSETIQESGKAQQVILRLSNLLRFIIEKCSQPKIALKDELQVIRDFVALEQYRHESRLVIDFKVDLLDEEVLIPPLLFLPLVENSFKHTLNRIRGPIHINIDVKADSNYIHFSVKNDMEEHGRPINGHAKNGIANTRRQLELLFGTHYALEIWEAKGKYNVTLAVPVKQKAIYA
jgi:LytS/YehU family sensor histidine kinase